MKNFNNLAIALSLLFVNQGLALAQTATALPRNAPEIVYLADMGFDILEQESNKNLTVAKGPTGIVLSFSTVDDRIAISRAIGREKILDTNEELVLHRKINELNIRYYLQITVHRDYIQFAAYVGASPNKRLLSKTISHLELVPRLALSDKELLKLLIQSESDLERSAVDRTNPLLNDAASKRKHEDEIMRQADEIIRRGR